MRVNGREVTSVDRAQWEAAYERQQVAIQIAEAEGVDKNIMLALAELHGADFLRVYLERKRMAA